MFDVEKFRFCLNKDNLKKGFLDPAKAEKFCAWAVGKEYGMTIEVFGADREKFRLMHTEGLFPYQVAAAVHFSRQAPPTINAEVKRLANKLSKPEPHKSHHLDYDILPRSIKRSNYPLAFHRSAWYFTGYGKSIRGEFLHPAKVY